MKIAIENRRKPHENRGDFEEVSGDFGEAIFISRRKPRKIAIENRHRNLLTERALNSYVGNGPQIEVAPKFEVPAGRREPSHYPPEHPADFKVVERQQHRRKSSCVALRHLCGGGRLGKRTAPHPHHPRTNHRFFGGVCFLFFPPRRLVDSDGCTPWCAAQARPRPLQNGMQPDPGCDVGMTMNFCRHDVIVQNDKHLVAPSP